MKQKLSETIKKMVPGDTAESDGNGEYPIEKVKFKITKGGSIRSELGDGFYFCRAHFEWDWEIIRAEPEVLTACEYVTKTFDGYSDDRERSVKYEAFEAGNKNGQIKEWKRLKPLIDAAWKLLKESENNVYHSVGSVTTENFKTELKNLTPPWECEK